MPAAALRRPGQSGRDRAAGTEQAAADATLSYKYDLGGTWNDVDGTADYGSVNNQTMSVNGGIGNDTVAAWAGIGGC
jgi:hypothetical protein